MRALREAGATRYVSRLVARSARGSLVAGLLVPIAGLAPGAAAQQELGTDCTLEEYASVVSDAPVPGQRITWLSSPFLVCPDGTRLRSDSAVVYEAMGRAELMGAVRYETDDRLLEADFADYYEDEGRLFARGSVVFTDRDEGTVLRGDTLTRLAPTPARPDEQVRVSGARPSAELPSDEGGAPYLVTGDRLRFEGQDYFWADGDVEVLRDDLEASSDSLAFDQELGQLFLNGNARVVSDAEMEGNRIQLRMPDDVLELVILRESARLWTDDLEVTAEEIRITLADEMIQQLVAVHRGDPAAEPADEPDPSADDPDDPDEREAVAEAPVPSEPAADGPPRPRAVSDDFVFEADSLHVESPDEVLETVHGVGRARAESRGRDESIMAVATPGAEDIPDDAGVEEVPELTDSDWIEGDEVLAFFEPGDPEAAGDVPAEDPDVDVQADVLEPEEEGASEYRLERLEARGNAKSLYRSPPEDDEEANEPADDPEEDDPDEQGPDEDEVLRWSISYIVAEEILIHMVEGEVDRMEANEQVIGIQLEPVDRPASEASGTEPSRQEDDE